MFVKTLKTPLIAGILSSVVLLSAISGTANSSELADENPTIPVTVELSGVQLSDGPLYISVQTRDQFQGVKGYGTVVKKATPGAMSVTVNIGESGEYGIMVWHDLNDDGVFSMSDSYQILDGWVVRALCRHIVDPILMMRVSALAAAAQACRLR